MLKTLYQNFIHKQKYAKWLEEEQRFEAWEDTVTRYVNFFEKHLKDNFNYVLSDSLKSEIFDYVYNLKVMGSMRCMMTAGDALEKDNAAGYNCSYLTIGKSFPEESDDQAIRCFSEVLYNLMCGCGVGFSVERQFTETLPVIKEIHSYYERNIVVEDSRIGWCEALNSLILSLYAGYVPSYDLSGVRPSGVELKTFGGRSAGPEVLDELFKFIIELFTEAQGRRLKPIECHDLCCHIAMTTSKGGVRRAALISLSDLDDEEMKYAKRLENMQGKNWRHMSNNSAVIEADIEQVDFMDEWINIWKSKSGERGLFFRDTVRNAFKTLDRDDDQDGVGTNPCSEISLKPYQFCNLTEVILPNCVDHEDVRKAVKIATILGTFQSSLTDFRFLRDVWRQNCAKERLLGVSLSGICDVEEYRVPGQDLALRLSELKALVHKTNAEYAKDLGIPKTAAATCVKPSGTVSQLVNCSSGIHESHAQLYDRAVLVNKKEPLFKFIRDNGFRWEDQETAPEINALVYFLQDRRGSYDRKSCDLRETLERFLMYQLYWADHSVSRTVYVKDDEWLDLADTVFAHKDQIKSLSFFPFNDDDSVYPQPVYREITETEFNILKQKEPKRVDWTDYDKYHSKDGVEIDTEIGANFCGLGGCDG